MPLTASELHRRGIEAANARRFAAARRALAQASVRTEDVDLRARIDGTTAYVLAQTGEPSAAEQLCRQALSRRGLHDGTVAVLSGQLGVLLMHAGRLADAERMLTRAIDTMGAATIELANCLMNRSVVRMQQHRLDVCRADLMRAVDIYEQNAQEEPLAEARHNLGYVALLGGDLVSALALMTQARPVLAQISHVAAAISDLDRAEVLRDAGLDTEAEALLAEVAARFGAHRMRQARAEAEFHLARSLLRRDPAAAERTARTSARRFSALGSDGWRIRAEALRLEAAVRAHPRTPPPREALDRTASALRRRGLDTEATALRLTAGLIGRRRLPHIPVDAPTPLRLREHEVLATRAASAGRDAEARRIAAAGLGILSAWQQTFGALDLQASVAMHGTDLVFTGLAAAARTGDPDVLFDWSERARHLSQQVAPLRPPHDPLLAADLAELRMLRADLAGSDWTADPTVRLLRDRVRERQWSTVGAGETKTHVTVPEIRSQLDPQTAVLSYVYTGTELLCVVVTRGGADLVTLSWRRVQEVLRGLRADLDVAALTRGGPMHATIARALDARLQRLDAELFAPVLATAGDARRFALTVPGVLGGIPWAMLPNMAGLAFTIATSISRWVPEHVSLRDARVPPDPASAPAPPLNDVGGERSEHAVAVSAPAVRRIDVGFAAGPRVPRAEEEVRRAASAWPATEVLGSDAATVAGVTELAGRVDLLHIAAHGRHSADNPLFSGFELADGTLFGYDIDLIPQPPATVVLSACELGRSSVRWGEEAIGMTRVWLHAGSRCVIAAPAVVADDIACELLGAVHAGLAAGAAPAVALASAAESAGLRAPFQCHGAGF
ncbi:CHAT domain-containing protein [Microbacterium sp.]|uniref:CHAT domain-containing protein n=1 Tax=Microbacterium sp. TaxID=51671 RepID=UPI002811306B|nr:CHAT domain-containing protein [Microbacterium sp.]